MSGASITPSSLPSQTNFLTHGGSSLISDGTDARWALPSDTIVYHDDFIGGWDSTKPFGAFSWFRQAQTGGGIGAADSYLAAANQGLLVLKSGSGGGWGGIGIDDIFKFGGGQILLEFCGKAVNTGDATNDFSLFLGFGDRYFDSAAEPENGVYFHYNQGTNSGNWVAKTASTATRTSANSSTALDTNYHRFSILVNAGGTSISFYIDGTEIDNSPITTNIPSKTGLQFGIQNVAGAEREFVIDYVTFKQLLTTAR